MEFLDRRHERTQTFKNKLFSQGDNGLLVKQNTIQKISESSLCYDDLRNLYNERKEKEALITILSEAHTNSRSSRSVPRGTKHPETLSKIIEHFQKK